MKHSNGKGGNPDVRWLERRWRTSFVLQCPGTGRQHGVHLAHFNVFPNRKKIRQFVFEFPGFSLND